MRGGNGPYLENLEFSSSIRRWSQYHYPCAHPNSCPQSQRETKWEQMGRAESEIIYRERTNSYTISYTRPTTHCTELEQQEETN